MIDGLNDTEKHLDKLKTIFKDSGIRINLLPYHSIPGDSRQSSPAEQMNYFKHNLVISGISASIRKSRGLDISAACGLLASGLS
jgi:23S rRNA (adenine2503-C2)-methyltransferase